MRSLPLIASLLAVLSACGTKGPLTLPPPATAAKASPADNNKPAEALR